MGSDDDTFFKDWREETKQEEYSIYNDYWREHFLANGRLLSPRVDASYQQALNMLKPAPFYVPKEGVMDLLWLNGRPPEPAPEIVPKVDIDKWAELFDCDADATANTFPADPPTRSLRSIVGLPETASDRELDAAKRRMVMRLYAKRRRESELNADDTETLRLLTDAGET